MYQTNTVNGRQLALSGYGPDVSSKKRKLSEFSAGTSTPPPAGHPLASGSRPYYPSYPSSSSHLASAPNSGVGTNPRSNDMSRTRAPRPVFPSSDPVPPFYGISSTHGTYSTYASRLKLGTTSLIQPILAGSAPPATPSTQNNAGSVGLSGRRSRNVVNYAELDGMNEDGDGEDEGDEEFTTSSRTRGTPASSRRAIPAPPVPPVEKPPIPAPVLPTRTYLGEPPPGNLVMVKPAIRTRHLHSSTEPDFEKLKEAAKERAVLVPIRIELDTDTLRVRDSFVWNVNEPVISPIQFAQIFCDDIDLPWEPYVGQIASSIQQQLDEWSNIAEVPLGAEVEDEDEHAFEPDLRVIVNLDVQIGTLHLIDRVEWDLASSLTPELFAAQLCVDLGLSGEAAPLIAHAVHEELIRHKKDCLEIGLVGRADHGRDIQRGAKRMEGVWREWPETALFGPRVEVLTAEDIERLEGDRERASRRMRRETNRFQTSRTGRKR